MKLQRELFNNAGDFVAKIYEKTASPRVYLAHNGLDTETSERTWSQRGWSVSEAVQHANEFQHDEYDDCYLQRKSVVTSANHC